MRVWRLTRVPHAVRPLSGEGAARVGSRWNSVGVRIAYTSTTRALALLELFVHVTRDTLPADPILVPVDVPDGSILEAGRIPKNWNDLPYSPSARQFGDRWVEAGNTLALLVPSVIVPKEHNLLINPAHPGFSEITVRRAEPFAFDARLLR